MVVNKGNMQCRKREKVLFLLQHWNDNSSTQLHYMPQILLVPISLPKGTFLPICMSKFIHKTTNTRIKILMIKRSILLRVRLYIFFICGLQCIQKKNVTLFLVIGFLPTRLLSNCNFANSTTVTNINSASKLMCWWV